MPDDCSTRSLLNAVELTPAFLCSQVWTLGAPSRHPSAYHVTFKSDGAIAGWSNPDDWTWSLEDGTLVFLDEYDRRSVVFDLLTDQTDGGLEMLGRPTDSASIREPRVLRRREPAATLPSAPAKDVSIRVRPGLRRRRNLVILRANEASLHTSWVRNISNEDRNWDLCISFYGNPDNSGRDEIAEYQIVQGANRKYFALLDLLYDRSPFWAYDWFAFPDDDMMTSWRDLNEMFAVCRRHNLLLAQPAQAGYITHPFTRPHADYELRYTSFVEAIAPWFSREALRICAPTFSGTLSAYGLDHVWPKLLGEPRDKLAIVDKIVFEHTRPVAQSYDMEEALAEAWSFQMSYCAYPREVEFGGILKTPVDRYLKW